MTGGRTQRERLVLGPDVDADEPATDDAERTQRTVVALERLRTQLLHTQGVLDDYLERLDAHADGARPSTRG